MGDSAIINYIKAVRPFTMIYFIEVVLGSLYSIKFNFMYLDAWLLAVSFISFESLYRGIYVLNDIIDYDSDRMHPEKSRRVIASGKIRREYAFIFAMVLVALAFAISFFVSQILLYFELFFLAYNLLYSFVLKTLPFIDTFAGGVTHMMRFVMGTALAAGFDSHGLAAAIFLAVSGLLFIKRFKELKHNEKVRHQLKYYNLNSIRYIWISLGLIILALSILSEGSERAIILIILLLYTFSVIGYLKIRQVNHLFNKFIDY